MQPIRSLQTPGREGLTRLCIYPIALTLVGAALASPWRLAVVSGRSMYPTLKPWSLLIYDSQYYSNQPILQGDVVLLRWRGQVWVKRVYGVPGKVFWALRERLDGTERCTPISAESRVRWEALTRYLQRHRQFAQVVEVRVQPGHVFVLGDGTDSIDSRVIGQIPTQQILGHVMELPWQDLGRNPADLEWTLPHRGRTPTARAEHPTRKTDE